MSYTGGRLKPFFDRSPVERACRGMAEHGGRRMAELVKMNTPIGHQPFSENYIPGHLRESIRQKLLVVYFKGGRQVFESGAETDVDYAPFVEHGTGLWGPRRAKYEIRPKNPEGWLRFTDQKTGEVIFAKRVMHPGSPGNEMFTIGVALTEHEFNIFGQRYVHAWSREQEQQALHQAPIHVGLRP